MVSMKSSSKVGYILPAMLRFFCFVSLFVLFIGTTNAQAAPFAYIGNHTTNTVSVIDLADPDYSYFGIDVGNKPNGIAASLDGLRVYVTNIDSNSVSVIDTTTNSVIHTIEETDGSFSSPQVIAVSPDGSRIYVTNTGVTPNYVSVIDTFDEFSLEETVNVGPNPQSGIAVSPDGSLVYVTNIGSNIVSVIDTASFSVDEVTVGSAPAGIAVNFDGSKVYVANNGSNSVSVIDTTNPGLEPITIGGVDNAAGVAASLDGERVYVTNFPDGRLFVIDTDPKSEDYNKVIYDIDLGASGSNGISIHPEGTHVYVPNSGSNTVSVINTATLEVETIAGFSQPWAIGQFISGAVSYTVTPSAGDNGSIDPNTAQTVNHGETTTFTVTPETGYTASVGGTCGGTLVDDIFTTNPITANCTVEATFSLNTYTVTPSAGDNGSIDPNTAQTVNFGETTTFTVTPETGYTASVGGTCGGTLVGDTFTTSPVTANCTVEATFSQDSYTIGGTVSGLAADNEVILQNNDGDDLIVSANGFFTFTTPLDDGSAYNVTVLTQPTSPNQTCLVANGSGTVTGANVTNIVVDCSPNTIGGTVSGLADGNQVVLQNNGGDDLIVPDDGPFTFDTPLANGSSYNVTVLTHPTEQNCTVTNGRGTVIGTDVTDVQVTCKPREMRVPIPAIMPLLLGD